jgi:ABC-type bacteriocin/lantibiotic exporter with double-glycine peptidase domain
VAHLNHDHFVVVRDCDEENVHVINGDRLALVPRRVFESTWSRHGLLLSKTVLEPESSVSGRVWWRSFWVWLGRCSIAVSAVFMVGALTIRRLRRIGLLFKSV